MKKLYQTIQTYDKIARKYESRYGNLPKSEIPYLQKFYNLASLNVKRPKILDAGCGTGRDLAYLEALEADLYGVDLAKNMLNIARNKLKKSHLLKADIRKLPFPNEFFNGVLCIATLVHLPTQEKEKSIGEFWRVLKSNGVLYISVQNLLYFPRFLKCIKYRRGDGVFYDGRYWYFPTKHLLNSMLKRQGFDILYTSPFYSKRLRFYCRKVKKDE